MSDFTSDSGLDSASDREGPQVPFRSSRSAARRRRRVRQMQGRRLYEADLPDQHDDDSDDGSESESSAQWATTLYATPEQLRNLPPLPPHHSNYVTDNAAASNPINPFLGSPVLTESDSEDSENGLNNAVFDDSDIDEAASDISADSFADVVLDPRILKAIAPADSERNPIVIKCARIITRMRARIAENPVTITQERRNAIKTIGEIFPLRRLTYAGGFFTRFQPLGLSHEEILLDDIKASLAMELHYNELIERFNSIRDRTQQLSDEVSDEEYITDEEFHTDEEYQLNQVNQELLGHREVQEHQRQAQSKALLTQTDSSDTNIAVLNPRELRIEIIKFVARAMGFIVASASIIRYYLHLLETFSYRPHLVIATMGWATALALLAYLFFGLKF
ncbi:hypothetical protein CFIO01_01841 [Colletotrichum fioriniae PJ7]|uniref:Uncharacterized protein n=1 Tax=Colletotrichum fioriniae PJ7 TaxID=1445577 RepID=A0A010RPL9_9PEZI|nr:hypothetical protein CFIO01_01841 [Colletotrichum fioriniae PJ7]